MTSWATAFTAAAHAHWTPARTALLTAGKRLRIVPAEAPLLLRALGLLHRDATMPPTQVRKFLQINHMVGVLEPSIEALIARHDTVRILDAGCGRSYLTLLIAWCARARWGRRVEILGIDRNPAVIAECVRRTEIAELGDVVRFAAASLDASALPALWTAAFGATPSPTVHAVFALHACDTATCEAIALGVGERAELIAVAPCCQAELARGWTELAARGVAGPFAPIWGAPHLRRETAAHVTDAMRTELLRAAGYAVTPMEFIAAEHTKKNTLIRALRTGTPDPAARAAYDALVAGTGGCGLALAQKLSP